MSQLHQICIDTSLSLQKHQVSVLCSLVIGETVYQCIIKGNWFFI